MATVEELRLEIKASVADAVGKLKQYDRQTKETTSATKSMQSTFAQMRDVMQGPIAAFNMVMGVIKKVGAVMDKAEDAWEQQEEAVAILNATLEATGATAWTTSEQIQKMASGFQDVTKYGDETVIAMQNVLLGFRNIKGDNFEEASLQILNMATVMKMDLKSAAQAVGKALDNPILGMDSLSKQGFKFTEQEKEMIASLVEAGKLEEAQGVILTELSKTFGGAAVAAGQTGSAIKVRLGNAIGDLNEQLGRLSTEALKGARLSLLDFVKATTEAIQTNGSEINEWVDTFASFGESFENMFKNIDPKDLEKISKSLREVVFQISRGLDVLSESSGKQLGDLVTVIANTFEWISNALGGYIDFYSGIFTGDWSKTWEGLQKIVLVFSKNVLEIIQSVINAGLRFAQGFIDIYNKVDEKIKILPDWKITLAPIDLAPLNAVEKRLAELGIGVKGKKSEYKVNVPAIPSAPSGGEYVETPADSVEAEKEAIQEAYDLYEERVSLYSSSTQQMYDELDQYRKNDLEKEKEAQAKKLEHAKAYFDFIASAAENVFTAYMDYEQNKSDVVISNLEKQRDAMKENGEETAAIDEKIKGEKNRIAKKQFEAEKLNSLAKIVMSTAESVQKAYSELGPIAGSIAAGVVGAAGIAQGAMVMSQQYVPMAEGGRGTVTKPTLFLAGEAGPEDFAFGPKRKGGLSGGTTVVNNYYGSPWAIREAEAVAMGGLARAGRGY